MIFVRTYKQGQLAGKGIEVDPRSDFVTRFKSLVDLRVLLDCIGWYRPEEHGEPRLLNLMRFPYLDEDSYKLYSYADLCE